MGPRPAFVGALTLNEVGAEQATGEQISPTQFTLGISVLVTVEYLAEALKATCVFSAHIATGVLISSRTLICFPPFGWCSASHVAAWTFALLLTAFLGSTVHCLCFPISTLPIVVETEFGDVCRSFSTNRLTEVRKNLTKIFANKMEAPMNLSALGLYGLGCEKFSDYIFI